MPDAEMLRGIMAKAEEKLSRAERDLADGFPDDAASRAYYATFHGITAVLATRGAFRSRPTDRPSATMSGQGKWTRRPPPRTWPLPERWSPHAANGSKAA